VLAHAPSQQPRPTAKRFITYKIPFAVSTFPTPANPNSINKPS